jgi:hypothetical protein
MKMQLQACGKPRFQQDMSITTIDANATGPPAKRDDRDG